MYKVKNNGYNPLSLIFLILIILFVFNTGYILRIIQPNLSFGKAKMNEVTRIRKDNFDKDQSIFLIDHGLIQILGNEMIYIDEGLNKKWSKEINGTDVKILNNGSFIYVIDCSLGDIFKIDYEGNITAKIFSQGTIKKVINHNDEVLVILTEKNNLIAYNESLEIENKENLHLSNILDIKKNNDQYYILNLEHKNKTYFTRLVNLDKTFAFLSNLNVNNTIIYNMDFSGDKRLIQSNKKMLLIDAADEILWTVETDYFIHEVVFDDYIYVYASNEKNNENDEKIDKIIVYDRNGIKIEEMLAPIKNVKKMIKYDEKLFIVNDKELCIIDNNLEVLFIREMIEDIKDIRVLSNKKIILDTEDNLVIYEFEY